MHFLPRADSTEQRPFLRVFPSATHFTAESIGAMRIKCLAQGYNILMLPEFEPSISVSRNRHPNHMTNTLDSTNRAHNKRMVKSDDV